MDLGEVGSMRELGVTESYKLKKQVVVSASEAAEMILRSVFSTSSASYFLNFLFSTRTVTLHQVQSLMLFRRVDNILRSAPRRREG